MSKTPDKIVLSGLEFHGFHGVFEEESRLGARFVVDAELHLDIGGSDRLEDTVDYSAVYELIRQEVTEQRHKLIETLAHTLAGRILAAQPRLERVLVRVHKPHAPLPGVLRDVYAEVVRTRG